MNIPTTSMRAIYQNYHTFKNEPIYQKDRYAKYDSLVSHGILCHYGNFSDGTSYEEVNKYCHG
jgi:hypothetical protein